MPYVKIYHSGERKGTGVYTDGYVVGHSPTYTEYFPLSDVKVSHYVDVPDNAVVVQYGRNVLGAFHFNVRLANGDPVPFEKMKEIRIDKIWEKE